MFSAVAFLSETLILQNTATVLAKPAVACYLYYLSKGIIAIVVY
jgi:hypothetical protein